MDIRNNKKSYVKEAKKKHSRKRGQSTVFVNKPKGRFVSFWSQVIGFILAAVGGVTFLILTLYSMARGINLALDSYLMLFLFLIGALLFYKGYNTKKFHGRFRFYRRLLEGRDTVSLEELSDMTNRKVPFLQKDLKKMIEQKMFLQARLDSQEKYLLLTEEAYAEHMAAEAAKDMRNAVKVKVASSVTGKCESAFAKVEEEKEESEKNQDHRTFTEEHLTFYEEIGKRIKTRSVQRIVTDLGVYTVQILSCEIATKDRERFLNYYLPVTKSLLLSYEDLEKEGVAQTAMDLEDILNTIRYSYETFAGKLVEGETMDVETDILALEDIWRKE